MSLDELTEEFDKCDWTRPINWADVMDRIIKNQIELQKEFDEMRVTPEIMQRQFDM